MGLAFITAASAIVFSARGLDKNNEVGNDLNNWTVWYKEAQCVWGFTEYRWLVKTSILRCEFLVKNEKVEHQLREKMKQFLALGFVAGLLLAIGCESAETLDPIGSNTATLSVEEALAAAGPSNGGPPIGEMAPEIEGVDLDGVEFKLSDYRGQVIMLDFYGDWWPPCRAMYDHERSLVNEMKKAGKPFALIGVNVNDKLEKIQKATKEKDLNWRSFFCGRDTTIPDSYSIQGYPSIVFIDAKGVVRGVGHGPNDALIDALLAEVQWRDYDRRQALE